MKITRFNIKNKKATYIYTQEYLLEETVRRWMEASYLIRRGYTILGINGGRGLCDVFYYNCDRCIIDYDRLCVNVSGEYDPEYKHDVKEVHEKYKYLKKLEKESKE